MFLFRLMLISILVFWCEWHLFKRIKRRNAIDYVQKTEELDRIIESLTEYIMNRDLNGFIDTINYYNDNSEFDIKIKRKRNKKTNNYDYLAIIKHEFMQKVIRTYVV